tara:strand:+ start:245 stop:490 length:246 start_codon:yes stop_codon:yes gene_type:complete
MDDINEETLLTTREYTMRLTCSGTVRDILSGGYRVQPVPPGNSVTLATSIMDTDTGSSNSNERPLVLGNPTSLAPRYIGIK